MSNKQSSIEWLVEQTYELFEQYWDGNFDRIMLNKLVLEATKQAKEMHKQELIKAYIATDNILQKIAAEKYYNKKFGGNNE